VHILCKKKLTRNRGEYVVEELLSFAFLMNVISEIPGCQYSYWVEGSVPPQTRDLPQVQVSKEGINTAMGNDTRLPNYELVLPIFIYLPLLAAFFTATTAQRHLTQPKQPTAGSFIYSADCTNTIMFFPLNT